jgi:hypothetical protein
MSHLVHGHDFTPTWEAIQPYIALQNAPEQERPLLQSAQKAIFAFLCTLVPGLSWQVKNLNKADQKNPYLKLDTIGEFEEKLNEALALMRETQDRIIASAQSTLLKTHAEELMKKKADPNVTCWQFLC